MTTLHDRSLPLFDVMCDSPITFKCTRCGALGGFTAGCANYALAAALEGFRERHQDCQAPPCGHLSGGFRCDECAKKWPDGVTGDYA